MTNEEKEILKLMGVKFPKRLPINTNKITGVLNGYYITKESYYWIVKGNIPYKYAKMFEAKPKLEMRVNGSGTDVDHWCTHNFIEKSITSYWETHTLGMYSKENFEEYMGVSDEEHFSKYKEEYYISFYHIDTLEGIKLIINTIKNNKLEMKWW